MSAFYRFATGGLPAETREFLTTIPGVRLGATSVAAPEHAAWIVESTLQAVAIGYSLRAPRRLPPRTARAAVPYLREWVPAFLTEYQRNGIVTALGWPDESGMFIWSAGSGKTLASIVWALAAGERSTVAVTKAAVRPQWARQVEQYTKVPAIILEGATPTLPALPPPPYFLVTSYPTLPHWIHILCGLRPHSVIFDESHLVQSHKRWNAQVDLQDEVALGELRVIEGGPNAPEPAVKVTFDLKDNIAAAAYLLSRAARRRLATTATPIGDRVRNLWGQLDLVRPWEWGSFYVFARRYCAAFEGMYGGVDTRGASNLDELKRRLTFVRHHVPFSVANRELPSKRRQVSYIPVRDQVKPEAIAADLRAAARHGPSALLEMRLMEAASRKRRLVAEHVRDALASKQKVVVFTGRRRDVEALERTIRTTLDFPNRPDVIHGAQVFAGHGGLPVDERDALARAYMAAPGPAVLIGTGDAFGEGMDLQDTDLLVLAMLPYTPKAIIQWEGRVARLGQKRPVLILYLICEGTVDEHVATILLNKLPAVEKTLDLDEVRGLGRELVGASEAELLASLCAKALQGPREPDAGSRRDEG